MEEKRHPIRHKALKGARIVFNHGSSTVNCVVRSISDEGASLEVDNLGVPHHFTLVFNEGDQRFECEIVWRREDALGVRFIAPPP